MLATCWLCARDQRADYALIVKEKLCYRLHCAMESSHFTTWKIISLVVSALQKYQSQYGHLMVVS